MFETYPIVLLVHVAAAVVLVGHATLVPVTRAALRKAGTLAVLKGILAYEHQASRWNPAVALVLLASGLYLGSAGWWTFGWFYVSVAGWMANMCLAVAVVKPGFKALTAAAAAAGEGDVPAHVDALRRLSRLAVGLQVMLANDLALLFTMMVKPSALGAVAALAIVNAVLLAPVAVPRRAEAPALAEVRS